jgi:hypothetical protein
MGLVGEMGTADCVEISTPVIASEAKQSRSTYFHWIASSLTLLAMTKERFSHSLPGR